MSRMRARIFVHRIPIKTPVRTSFGTMSERPSVLIRLEDGDGNRGWGEVWCNYPSVGAEHRARLLKATVLPLAAELGDFGNPETLWSALSARLRVLAIQTGEPGPFAQCLAGLECALQDLAARREGKPLWRYLAPDANESVRAYASGINPNGALQSIERAIESGFTACKIKVGFDPKLDRQNMLEARKLLGDGRVLMADANQAWHLEAALAFAGVAEAARLAWLEEPLAHDESDENWRKLADRLPVPLAAGENFARMEDFNRLPEARGVRILQPDLGKWGGVGQSMRVAAMARSRGLQFCPHWLGGGVGLLTSMHVKAASGATDGFVEVDVNPNPLRSQIAAPVLNTLANGWVCLPDEPGIGAIDTLIEAFNDRVVWSEELSL